MTRPLGALAALAFAFLALTGAAAPASAAGQYSADELVADGHHFFGGVSQGIDSIVEKAE